MNRRRFNGCMGASIVAISAQAGGARAAQAQAPNAALLQTTLTPVGAERAGNAAGTIPAWTGGVTEIPAGFDWDPDRTLPPDFFAADKPLYTIDASNMAEHAAVLCEGVKHLIQMRGLSLQVYPTRRTAGYPQWIYDNVAKNLIGAQVDPQGGRFGFTGAYGGIPFPIPDMSDPLVAGVQIQWNHQAQWQGSYKSFVPSGWVVDSNGVLILSQSGGASFVFPYYQPDGNAEAYDGYFYKVFQEKSQPANITGDQIVSFNSSDPSQHPNITWQLLAGQGRVRKTPNVGFDVPDADADAVINYDESFGFNGSPDRYDWKCLGKQEMLIPYNNNAIMNIAPEQAFGPKFLNPDVVRWELHRVWVVEATLHPGERNDLARRQFYMDEDTWAASLVDAYDANNALFHHEMTLHALFPNLPGLVYLDAVCYSVQVNEYVTLQGSWGRAPYNSPWIFESVRASVFNPQSMAAAANY